MSSLPGDPLPGMSKLHSRPDWTDILSRWYAFSEAAVAKVTVLQNIVTEVLGFNPYRLAVFFPASVSAMRLSIDPGTATGQGFFTTSTLVGFWLTLKDQGGIVRSPWYGFQSGTAFAYTVYEVLMGFT